MKKFPTVSAFEVNATDYSANFDLIVAEMVKMRIDHNMTWVAVEALYKASKYNEYLAWQKLYVAASKISKSKGKTAPKPEAGTLRATARATTDKAEIEAAGKRPLFSGSIPAREAKLQDQIAESKAKQPVEIVAQGEVEVEELPLTPPAPITVEGFFGVEGEAAELLRKILLKDLASVDSILLAEIQKKL